MFGAAGSTVTNAGKIETKTAVPTGTATGLVGIAVNASTGTNTGKIILGTKFSTGMFGAAGSTLINKKKSLELKKIVLVWLEMLQL